MIEEWREFKVEGSKPNIKHEVSNLGNVRSIVNVKQIGNSKHNIVIIGGKVKYVHRIVANKFLDMDYLDDRIVLKDFSEKGNIRSSVDNIKILEESVYKGEDILERYYEDLENISSKFSLLLKEEVLSNRRDKYIQTCRAECFLMLYKKGVTLSIIGKGFNRNHTSIIYTLKTYFPEEYKELRRKYK